ncbi:hypothetical protein GCM10017653_23060 [Ancylobacter defluvii]|uniref:Uncharacterized protein n=1 Tax=Ancylobacter defluvii TaxID=1282440 RepID=A0A9W6NB77_9HYPH|nr:hypothetical protein GCM10017653_23060 [Ancylobacter defluvii]
MPGMESPHGGHQRDTLAGGPPDAHAGAQFGNGVDGFYVGHGGTRPCDAKGDAKSGREPSSGSRAVNCLSSVSCPPEAGLPLNPGAGLVSVPNRDRMSWLPTDPHL